MGSDRTVTENIVLHGIAAAPGIAIGGAYLFSKAIPRFSERILDDCELENEIEKLKTSLQRSQKEVRKILLFAEQKLGDSTKILEAQVMVLEDPILTETLYKRIRKEKKNEIGRAHV